MVQAKHHLFPRHPALQTEARRLEQHQASQQAPYQRPVVGVRRLHLAGLGRQQVFERAEGMLNPTAPAPGPDQAWCGDRRRRAAQVEAFFPRFVDEDKRHPPIIGTYDRQSGIAEPLWMSSALERLLSGEATEGGRAEERTCSLGRTRRPCGWSRPELPWVEKDGATVVLLR